MMKIKKTPDQDGTLTQGERKRRFSMFIIFPRPFYHEYSGFASAFWGWKS